MNVFFLLLALRDILTPEMPTLPLPVRGRGKKPGVLRPPQVFVGGLPHGTAKDLEEVPFVVIQALQGYELMGEGLHRTHVVFRVAVQDEEPEAAENHLHNLLSLVRRAVMRAQEGGVVNGRYIMQPDDKGRLWFWDRPDEQLPPFVQAYALTTWAMKGIE
jgi:hypothetical protein